MNIPKVFVAIPNLGKIDTHLVHWLLDAGNNFSNSTVPINGIINLNIDRPVEVNRNKLANMFLKTDCTHLLMIDADIQPPTDLIPKWLKHDKDIIGGYVPIWDPQKKHPRFFAYNKVGDEYHDIDPSKGFQKCDIVGSGAIMFKRSVIEGTPNPRFKQVLDENGEFKAGEDRYFVELAQSKGFEVYVDPTPINQRTPINLIETLQKQPHQPKQNYDISKFKNKLFIGRQQKTPEGKTMDVVGNPDIKCDISKKIPCKANSFDYVEIHHLLEHFDDTIHIMNELHRILKHGGILDVKVPYGITGANDDSHKKYFYDHTFERYTPEFWKAYSNIPWDKRKWYHILQQEKTKNELHVIFQADKKIVVKI